MDFRLPAQLGPSWKDSAARVADDAAAGAVESGTD